MSLSVVNDAVIGTGMALSVDIPSFTLGAGRPEHLLLAHFTQATVGQNIGDHLRLSFDFRLKSNTSPSDGAGFRFGIGHSDNTIVASDMPASDLSILADDRVYFGTIGTGGSHGYEILRGAGFLGGPGNAFLFRDESTAAPTINDTLSHSLSLTIERVAGSALAISLAVDGIMGTGVDSSASRIDTFNEIIFLGQVSNLDYTIDNVLIRNTSVPAEPPGDYDGNGVVDAADYVVWRHSVGNVVPPGTNGDANGNGFVENSEYQPWRANYGRTAGIIGSAAGSGSSSESASVPEPSALLLLGIGAISLLGYRKAKSHG